MSYVTTTHTNHTIHACAAAIRAATAAMRKYATTRATNRARTTAHNGVKAHSRAALRARSYGLDHMAVIGDPGVGPPEPAEAAA